MNTPVITIFVRHSAGCKYAGDEFSRRCDCRKHLRWTQAGIQHRVTAGTRSWAEAEENKRQRQDILTGRPPDTRPEDNARTLRNATEVFLKDKRVQGVTPGVRAKYARELDRLREFCEREGVYTVQGITREILTGFLVTWEAYYPSSNTRAKVRERLRSFLRYCYEAQWVPRVHSLPKIKVDEPPTMPLTADEYARLLEAVETLPKTERRASVRALFQLMRHSGLAIRDALTLKRDGIIRDNLRGVYRIVTARQKTGTHVSVPIPPDVAQELLAVANGNPRYVFWSGNGAEESATKNWAKYYVSPTFKAAGLAGGHMMSHRLRDTFAVDLLTKGVPLEEVSKLLGHTSIRTTEKHYAKWVKGRQDRLDSLVMGTWGQ